MTEPLKQSDPRATFRRVYFTCLDAAALATRLQSSDMSTFVIYLSKNGATPALNAAVPVQVSAANMKGRFYVELSAADLDTPGRLQVDIKNTGGTKSMEPREYDLAVEPAYLFTVTSSTTTAIACDHAKSTANFFKNALVEPLTGTGVGQLAKCSTSATGLLELDADRSFASALSGGDIIELHVN